MRELVGEDLEPRVEPDSGQKLFAPAARIGGPATDDDFPASRFFVDAAVRRGEPRRFRPLIDLYRETGERFGFSPDQLKVGMHALGYVAATTQEAAADFFPGYARAVTDVGKERGWPPVTRAGFDAQRGPLGALLIGSPDEVVEKIVRHSEALGGISRLTFQMNAASLPQGRLMQAIETIGTRVAPAVREEFADTMET
jgi:alkanesulfonate monooxygenase SsuD/methylene tetrahydromethanopterin reductase-like flavin-dependent oxidoreductase (luciferase family)